MMDNGSTVSQQPKKKTRQLTEDVILRLPKDVIDAILICLPLRDAVRTSILSHAWRYTWTDISEIVIDSLNCPLSESLSQTEYDKKIVSIVDQVLLLHQGPIPYFELFVDFGSSSSKHIDRWLRFLSRNGTKEFRIAPLSDEKYKVPSGLFLCEEIITLALEHCIVIPPPLFNGFNKIRILELKYVSSSDDGLHGLLSNCPLLTNLTLKKVENCTRLYLSSPNLVSLQINSTFRHICFVDTPVLAQLHISLYTNCGCRAIANGATCELVKMLGCLPSISTMFLNVNALQLLSVGDIPLRLPTTTKLLDLILRINFDNMKHMLMALCIIRSSPNLRKVNLVASDKGNRDLQSLEEFWKAQDNCDGLFSELKTLHVIIDGKASELSFIEFVLASAPLLQMVHIKLPNEDVANKISRKAIRFRRLSSKAEVVILQ